MIAATGSGANVTLKGGVVIGGTLKTATGGSITLDGSTYGSITTSGTVTAADGANVFAQGILTNTGVIALASTGAATVLTATKTNLTLSGGGTVSLSDNAANKITGAATTATLTNVDNTINGSGAIGGASLTLINQASGAINGTGAVNALVIDTGAKTITNAGLIEATAAGGVTVNSVVSNTGVLEAAGGNLTLVGAVGGSGAAVIAGGTFRTESSFIEAASFTGSTGVLDLAQSGGYTGTITGFSHAGTTSLDLRDIAFISAGEATYSGTKTAGTLTVTDGVHTAHIKLSGDYTASTFIASSDGHGGTTIVDPTKGGAARFITAMAGLATTASAGTGAGAHLSTSTALTALAQPRTG